MVRLIRKVKLTHLKSRYIEMAFSRPDYLGFAYNIYPQIAQNWCLCKYCQLHRQDLKESYINWRGELETHLSYLNEKETSPLKNKGRWTEYALVKKAEMTNPDKVFKSCRVKFFHENEGRNGRPLGISEEHQKEVCFLFSQAVNDIVACISSDDIVMSYTRKEFPDDY